MLKQRKLDEFYFTDIIADELNVKEVKFADNVESFHFLQLQTTDKDRTKIRESSLAESVQHLLRLTVARAMDELNESNGYLFLILMETRLNLQKEDLLIEMAQKEGFVTRDRRG